MWTGSGSIGGGSGSRKWRQSSSGRGYGGYSGICAHRPPAVRRCEAGPTLRPGSQGLLRLPHRQQEGADRHARDGPASASHWRGAGRLCDRQPPDGSHGVCRGVPECPLTLQDPRGRTGHLPWQKITAISVASIGQPERLDQAHDALILDLILNSNVTPTNGQIRCLRLSIKDLAIPQLQNEPSPLRAFQRFVATILKTTGAMAHPSREACLGLPGFPAFPNLMAYETDLVPRLSNDP